MLPSKPLLLLSIVFAAFFVAPLASTAQTTVAASSHPASTLVLDGLGKGSAPLDGPWQFHLGDYPGWAIPAFDDSSWEKLTADKPWGPQGHSTYSGFAWYRRRISITPAPGGSPDVALLIPNISDTYELYWNGVEVGHLGKMPPGEESIVGGPVQTYGLGPIRTGVLAVRVWSHPPASNAEATGGGFLATPQIGSPQAIAAAKATLDYAWLRRQQFTYGLASLYTLVALLSFIAWWRDRKQWLFFWMAVFAFTPLVEILFRGLHIPYSASWLNLLVQTEIQIREASQWFLLLWLLQLHDHRKLVRFTRIAALIAFTGGVLDGLTAFVFPTIFKGDALFEIVDAVFTFPLLFAEIIPVILVLFAVVRGRRLDPARWFVATFAFLSAMIYAVTNISVQGIRFTHWTLSTRLNAPLFSLNGSPFNPLTIARIFLFLSIVYAVIRYSIQERRRQAGLEREIQNARELQQVLVPETLPALAGFALTSAYRPAQEVGGDFFQIIPLAGGGTLIILGDVSGKGLRAAMAVSLIVGATRASAETTSSPAEILAALNRRLYGRLNGGFATCVALRLDPDGNCIVSCAGHPSPYLNDGELVLPGALPLGIEPAAIYKEQAIALRPGDHLSLYTDGLLEARSASGELYGFDRIQTLFATQPDAAQATDAAVAFGQDDDITVLTLTRLETGQEPTAQYTAPIAAPA